MFTENQIIEIKEYLDEAPENSKIYLGSDSIKYKKGRGFYARYAIILVVHLAQKNGCKIFHYIERERIHGKGTGALRFRLMNECYKVSELYLKFADILEAFDVEVHLDLNSNPAYASNIVVKEATSYILGITGKKAIIKPCSIIASHAADHLAKYNTFHRGV